MCTSFFCQQPTDLLRFGVRKEPTQIPDISNRKYPAELAGRLYPEGIPIIPEEEVVHIIKENQVEQVVLAYSDLSYHYVMHLASTVLAAGADFRILVPK